MRLVLFGDTLGLPQLVRFVRRADIAALVGAAIRPAQHGALAALAAELEVPLIIQPRHDALDYASLSVRLADLHPDLFLVNSYAMLLRPDVLAVPRQGAVNLHGGLLPEQRGANPVEWAIVRGQRQGGASLHWMDDDFDTGDIIARHEVPIGFADTWLDVRRRVTAAAERLLAEILPQVLAGTAPRVRQDGVRANRFRRRNAADGRFTWGSSAIDIYNLVRALVAPHPGAWAAHPRGDRRDVFRTWRSLPEIVWLKSAFAGGFAEPGSRWRLVAERPPRHRERRRANRQITLGFCGRYDRHTRATIILTGLDDWRMAGCRIIPGEPNHRVAPAVLRAARHAARGFVTRELNDIAVVR
jgi:UDP-4-amino-4-deoxy-L-arabinose formyltransferase/UDP-glucuronic acid dehydrogenase (UDP-4-keto-hexauronic acid decarboxylating)